MNVAVDPALPRVQSAGGWAALFVALAYLVGFAVMATALSPPESQQRSPAELLAFLLDRKLLFQLWMVFIYVLAGGAIVVLSVALHERLKQDAPDAMQIATPFGLIWAGLVIASGMVAISGLESVAAFHTESVDLATTVWASVDVLQNGLGGGIEIVGGVWMLLVSTASFRVAGLPKLLSFYGALIGVIGIVTVIPPLKELATVFGLGQILWFAGVGASMLHRSRGRTESGGPTAAHAPQS